jgi:hypothetical protein
LVEHRSHFREEDGRVPTKRFTPKEIINKLRHADVPLGQGRKVAEIVKALGMTDVTTAGGTGTVR